MINTISKHLMLSLSSRTLALCLSLLVTVSVFPNPASALDELIIADFNTGSAPNNLGGDIGSWDHAPYDETQSIEIFFDEDDALGDPIGFSMRIDYDVDSPNPAYNGFWTGLQGNDFSLYNTMNFYIRGDEKAGFTKRLKIEIKDARRRDRPSRFIISGIKKEWQKFSIPFGKFSRSKSKFFDWTKMAEFVVVFDDIHNTPEVGTIYIDHITVSRE